MVAIVSKERNISVFLFFKKRRNYLLLLQFDISVEISTLNDTLNDKYSQFHISNTVCRLNKTPETSKYDLGNGCVNNKYNNCAMFDDDKSFFFFLLYGSRVLGSISILHLISGHIFDDNSMCVFLFVVVFPAYLQWSVQYLFGARKKTRHEFLFFPSGNHEGYEQIHLISIRNKELKTTNG